MNSRNITYSLLMQAIRNQTGSSVCVSQRFVQSGLTSGVSGKHVISARFRHDFPTDEDKFSTAEQNNTITDSELQSVQGVSSQLPPEPTNCCMTGCANCVWIQYAEELKNRYCSSSKETRDIILSKINDPSMKVFLSLELDHLEDECRWRPTKDNNNDS